MKPRFRISAAVSRFALVAALAAGGALGGQARAASFKAPDCYVKKDTWTKSMAASRAKYLEWREQKRKMPEVQLEPWYVTAPLPSKFSDVLFPERDLDRNRRDGQGQRVWRFKKDYADGKINALPGGKNVATYLTRTISASRPVTIPAYLGSDDGLAVWLNGKLLRSKDVARGVAADQDTLALNLAAGENRLLLKVYNRGGAYAFYFDSPADPAALLWQQLEKDFPQQASRLERDGSGRGHLDWFRARKDTVLERALVRKALGTWAGEGFQSRLDALCEKRVKAKDSRWLELYAKALRFEQRLHEFQRVDFEAPRLAIRDLIETYSPKEYPDGETRFARITDLMERRLPAILDGLKQGDERAFQNSLELEGCAREALLANPLLDFDQIMLIERRFGASARKAMNSALGMASLNSHNNTTIAPYGWDNEIRVLSDLRGEAKLRTLYKPERDKIITDVDLHFDGDRLMFSSPGTHDRWQIFEMGVDGDGLRQITPTDLPDIEFFDSCYLPNGKIAVTSTACYQGLPCEGGSKPMAPLYLMDGNGENIRQMTFEQDSDWCPTVLNNGRLMYLRWEYTDTPHYFSRILFHANPDGTEQMEYYGSNSYFPNALFYARPIPEHPTMVVGVVGGHHGISRSGRLLLVDPALGRHESDGMVTEIPRRGEAIEPIIKDKLVAGVWPQFLHPYPLSGKYFLVSAKLSSTSLWGIYLVDVFNNMTLIKEAEGSALLEPLPLRKVTTPPVIPDRVQLNSKEATVFLTDIYRGQGLRDIPRGMVKNLRLFSYHYAHVKTGGHNSVGTETSWDIKRILGTVPVEDDGSALFTIPANLPISLQPLDEEGRALQLMRSWIVGMPGETLSCVGCHEAQNQSAANMATTASRRPPSAIAPWRGSARPFSFKYEVQPVVDKYCLGCHDGSERPDGAAIPNFTGVGPKRVHYRNDEAYLALHPYVRRPGPESDIHVLRPMEYHADTSELIQMLKKGHHNVTLDREAWERLYTWIDLNAPYRGKWAPAQWCELDQDKRRRELAKRYANQDADPEGEYDATAALHAQLAKVAPVMPKPSPQARTAPVRLAGWPFDAEPADTRKSIDLGEGVSMDLTLIPSGAFVMGDAAGAPDEGPPASVTIGEPFWMGACEVTNAQFARFDPAHDSRYIDQQWKDHTTPGYPANLPEQPVIRISWEQAMAFCAWLSGKTGLSVTLPTEAQWEWACRAGKDTPFWYGAEGSDFAPHANLADANIIKFAVIGVNPKPIKNPSRIEAFIPRIDSVDDGHMIGAAVGQYSANPLGLHDMHGNVAEWTRSAYRPYPYAENDGRNAVDGEAQRVVRGGSWRDRPQRATASYRLAYEPYQRVFNVGFRVIVAAGTDAKQTAAR